MEISSSTSTSVLPRAAASNVKFSNNPQDVDALPNDTIDLPGVNANGGKPTTDQVVLENKKGIFILGQMVGMKPDPNYKLTPNADGNFVYADGAKNFNGANAFGAVASTVNKYNEVLGELNADKIEWAFQKPQLKVSPETGEYPNAFYARQYEGLHFFHYKTTSTAASGEVASHGGQRSRNRRIPRGLRRHHRHAHDAGQRPRRGSHRSSDRGTGDLSSARKMLSDAGQAFGHALAARVASAPPKMNSSTPTRPRCPSRVTKLTWAMKCTTSRGSGRERSTTCWTASRTPIAPPA